MIFLQNEIKKLSELIVQYSERLGLVQQSKILDVYSSWASIVGEKQAAHSKLIDIKHHTAVIKTDHPGWSQQLLLNKRYIIRNFQKKYPQLEVKNISVIISSHSEASYHFENSTNEIFNRQKVNKVSDEREQISMQQAEPIVSIDTTKTKLPPELQEAFKKLKMSIIERTQDN